MTEAYFSEGEEVELVSINHPDLNGDSVVLCGPYYVGDALECPHCGRLGFLECSGDYPAYYLSVRGDLCCWPWLQSALRKKHKPSKDNFETLLRGFEGVAGKCS